MIWLFIALAAVSTFVIAAVSVGGATAGLATRPRRSVYDLEEAIHYVAARLPAEVTGQVGYEDVQAVLVWRLEYLRDKGLVSGRTFDELGTELVVVSDDEPLAYLLGRVEASGVDEAGHDLDDMQVAAIVAANLDYERSIGMIGGQVTPPGTG